ncbi:MAG: nucleotide exchange factor GrpE [Nitrospira sp.]|nr:nucleotide exchange factor GrpE [Nitrospira sp.]MBH0181263.1 nucleotide exchange factor GrpE [Nitrospira sp.]
MNQEQGNSEETVNTIDALGDGATETGEPSATTVDPLLVEAQQALAAKTEEAKAANDKYLRLAADFENYKRMAQRDQRDQIKFGNEQLLKELLPVVDNLERAIKAARDDKGGSSAVVQGVDLTLKQLSSSLAKFGVQAVETVGQAFDPATHQAVSHLPSDIVPRDHVIDEFQKGYRLHDRILRAAMVSVSAGPAQTDGHHSTTH